MHIGLSFDSQGFVSGWLNGISSGAPSLGSGTACYRTVNTPLRYMLAGGDGDSSTGGYTQLHIASVDMFARKLSSPEMIALANVPPQGPLPISFFPFQPHQLPPALSQTDVLTPLMLPSTSQDVTFTIPLLGYTGFGAGPAGIRCSSTPAGFCTAYKDWSPLDTDANFVDKVLTLSMPPNVPSVTFNFTIVGDSDNFAVPFNLFTMYALNTSDASNIYLDAFYKLQVDQTRPTQNGGAIIAADGQGMSGLGSGCTTWLPDLGNYQDAGGNSWPSAFGGYNRPGWSIGIWVSFTLQIFKRLRGS